MSKTQNIITWIMTVILASMFIGAGASKVGNTQEMVQVFSSFGLPVWFMYLIGCIEIIGGLMLLVPALTGFSAFGLTIIMVGALSCHLMFTPISQGIPAIIALGMLAYVVVTRKVAIPSCLHKVLLN